MYNALNDSHYTREEDLEIVTLESCLYISIRNDLAFILDFRMHLYEHNEEKEWRKFREAEREYGRELGLEEASKKDLGITN